MTRKEEIESVAHQHNMCVGGKGNIITALVKEFIAGAEWADEHPSEKAINKRLYELGYGMSLNGDIITRQQECESVERYVKYKKKQLIDKAVEYLKSYRRETPDGLGWIAGIVDDTMIEDFRKAMEE